MGAGKTPEQWDEWTAKMQEAHGNGNGHGKSLEIEAQRLMPTPRATDGTKGGPNQRGSSGDLMLSSAVQLLPTPSVSDGTGGHLNRSGNRSDELLLPGVARALGEANSEAPLLPTPTAQAAKHADNSRDRGPGSQDDANLWIVGPRLLPTPLVGSSSEASHGQISGQWRAQMDDAFSNWGIYSEAIARWEATFGTPAPAPTQMSKKGNPQLAPAFVEWMMGLPAGHVTSVPGLSRNDMLKALGNGVQPQQAEQAVRHLIAAVFAT